MRMGAYSSSRSVPGSTSATGSSWAARIDSVSAEGTRTESGTESAHGRKRSATSGSDRSPAAGSSSSSHSNTPRGAEASCAAYSVVTTARACGLDDRRYVEWLLV